MGSRAAVRLGWIPTARVARRALSVLIARALLPLETVASLFEYAFASWHRGRVGYCGLADRGAYAEQPTSAAACRAAERGQLRPAGAEVLCLGRNPGQQRVRARARQGLTALCAADARNHRRLCGHRALGAGCQGRLRAVPS